MAVHPLVFEPIYKPKIWGGDRIFAYWQRPNPYDEPIGESWELADLEEDQSCVAAGPAAGKTITELIPSWGPELMGRVGLFEGRFPLLIKFLDARESLSVQVHPNEAVARKLGGNVRVKHEAWYILAAEPGGAIYHGLEAGVTADRLRHASLSGEVDGVLRKVDVSPGDCYYLPSGTPHALGAGVLVAEVQTSSDITYRTYDWGRVDPKTGRPRELHLEQALECIAFDSPSPAPMQKPSDAATGWDAATRLVTCPSFHIDRVRAEKRTERRIGHAEPVIWIILEGGGRIDWRTGAEPIPFKRGDTLLLPAASADARLRMSEATQWLEVTVPVK